MLDLLKRELRQNRQLEFVQEAMAEASDDRLKSAFLDGFETAVIGAENDPDIKDLAESIPEYEDDDENVVTDIEIKHLAENLTETSI